MKCKIFSIILMLLFFTACKAQNTILPNDTTKENSSLNDSEIKFIYHEAMRRLLYQKVPMRVFDNLYDFYSDEDINCNSRSLDILVSDKIINSWLYKYLDIKRVKKVFETNVILLSMYFNFQPNIYVSSIDTYKNNFPNSIVGYFQFSDIVENLEGYYYINGILNFKRICDHSINIWSGTIYTFEIERCSNGFLRFKKVIVGDGKEVPSSLGPISSIFELTDTEKCR